MNKTDLMRILGTNKIKYNVLDVEFESVKDEVDGYESVNIHLDLNSLLDKLFNEDAENFFNSKKLYHIPISSMILNIIAHFRAYFVYRHNISTRFYIYYTDSKISNSSYYHQFSNTKDYGCILTNINKSIGIVKTIVPYCNKINFMDTDKSDPIVCMKYTIDEISNFDKSYNVILTKDTMCYQLLNSKRLTYILRLKRDDTELLTKDNIYKFILQKNKYEVKHVSPELLSFYFANTGMKTRGIKNINKNKILEILDKAIEKKEIVNERYPKVEDLIDELSSYKLKDTNKVIDNYYMIDLKYIYKKLNIAHKTLLNNSISDKFDRDGLRSLNQNYFKDEDYLMIEELVVDVVRHRHIAWR